VLQGKILHIEVAADICHIMPNAVHLPFANHIIVNEEVRYIGLCGN